MNAKKPKVEVDDQIGEDSIDEQEEALVALIEHRTKEVQHIRKRIAYYQSQVSSFHSIPLNPYFHLSFFLSFFFFLLSGCPLLMVSFRCYSAPLFSLLFFLPCFSSCLAEDLDLSAFWIRS